MEIAVVSGKGGTGKSCISAAFASISGKLILADCDVDAANQYLIFSPEIDQVEAFTGSSTAVRDYQKCKHCGLCVDYCRFGALKLHNKRIFYNEIACEACKVCEYVCVNNAVSLIENRDSRIYTGAFKYGYMIYGRLAPGGENSGKMVSLVRSRSAMLAQKYEIPTVLIDSAAGIGCPVIAGITGVEKIVLVTEPSMSGVHDMKRCLEICQKTQAEIFVIINKSNINEKLCREIEIFCMQNNVDVAGKIPYDESIVNAMTNCKSIIEWAPGSETSLRIYKAFKKIINGK